MASVNDLTSQAGFVFEGQVVELGASAARSFAATPESAVVRVTRILKSTPSLAMYTGQQITVQMEQPASLKAGEQAVFFTHGIHYGDGLVVSELGNVPAGDTTMQDQVNTAVHLPCNGINSAAGAGGVGGVGDRFGPGAACSSRGPSFSAAVLGAGRRPSRSTIRIGGRPSSRSRRWGERRRSRRNHDRDLSPQHGYRMGISRPR